MKDKLILIGASGHCKVVADIISQNDEYEIVGLIDKSPDSKVCGISVIGNDDDLKKIYDSGINKAFVAIGDNSLRKKLINYLTELGYEIINVISKHAIISLSAKIGKGVLIAPGAIVNAYTNIGDGCIINTSSSVDHDCIIGNHSHIAPGSTLCGNVKIGEQTFICAGTTIINDVTIGSSVIVGAGSTVINNIEGNCKVVGVPAIKYL